MSSSNLVSLRSGGGITVAPAAATEGGFSPEIASIHGSAAELLIGRLVRDLERAHSFYSQIRQSLERRDGVAYVFCLFKNQNDRQLVVECCQAADLASAVAASRSSGVPLPMLEGILDHITVLEDADAAQRGPRAASPSELVLEDFGLACAPLTGEHSAHGVAVVTPTHVHSLGSGVADLQIFHQDLVHLDEVLSRQGVSRIVRAAAGDRPLKLWISSAVPVQQDFVPPRRSETRAAQPPAPPVAEPPAPPNSISSLAQAVNPVAPRPDLDQPADPPRVIRVRLQKEAPPPAPPPPPEPRAKITLHPPSAPPPKPAEAKKAPPPKIEPIVEPPRLLAPEPAVEDAKRPRVVVWVGAGAAILIAVVIFLVVSSQKTKTPPGPAVVQAPISSPSSAPVEAGAKPGEPATATAAQPAPVTPPPVEAKAKPGAPEPGPAQGTPADAAAATAKKAEAVPTAPDPKKAEEDALARKKAAIKALTGQ